MSFQDWGAIGEILSAAAIFVTLIYLATQIKYARLTAMDINRTNRVVGIRDLNGVIATNTVAREAWNNTLGPEYRRLHTDIAESLNLSFDQASIVISQGASWGYTHWAQYRSMKTPEDEAELKNIINVWYGENPMKALLNHENFRAFFEDDFISWLDEIIGVDD